MLTKEQVETIGQTLRIVAVALDVKEDDPGFDTGKFLRAVATNMESRYETRED